MKRVVVTGVGVVSPIGSDAHTFWTDLNQGRSGVAKLTRLPNELYPRDWAAEIKDWNHLPESQDPTLESSGQAVGYAVAVARMALEDAGFKNAVLPTHNRCGVLIGTTMGNQDVAERIVNQFDLDESFQLSREQAADFEHFKPSLLSLTVAKRFGCRGGASTYVNACAAGNYAVGMAFSRIRNGMESMILAGGADPFTRACYTIFHRLNASSSSACRPFDKDRDGMIVGEGAAMLVLEEYQHAIDRGARIYAEVTGYGLACDAYHATAPHPEGNGAVAAMQRALSVAGLEPTDINYVNAHGTGTLANDQSEAVGMSRVFGEALRTLPVSSIKSNLGHCMGAASALEAVACSLAIHHQKAPQTINTVDVDPAFPVPFDVLSEGAKKMPLKHIMSNAFAFGGNVSSVIFSQLSA